MIQKRQRQSQKTYQKLSLEKNGKLNLCELSNEEIQEAENGHYDYSVYDSVSGIAVAELNGRRRGYFSGGRNQEDRVRFEQVPALATLNADQKKQALKNAISEMARLYGNHKFARNSGSTLIAAIIQGTQIHIANVGDSNALLISITAEGSVTLRRINARHNPSDPKERKRIEDAGGKVIRVYGVARVEGSLAISRAIGDANISTISDALYKVMTEPDIYEENCVIPHGEKCFLILACDGLHEEDEHLERMKARIETLAKTKSMHELSTLEISQTLTKGAFADGSGDNLSVVVIPLKDEKACDPYVVMLADGHGGSEVSQALADNFISTIEKIAKKMLG